MIRTKPAVLLLILVAMLGRPDVGRSAGAMELSLPTRPQDAASGSALAERWAALSLRDRETELASEILRGNVPEFLRQFYPVTIISIDAARTNQIRLYVTPDYVAVGSDRDYLLAPMTPGTAQFLADRLGCSLPTPRIVDAIHGAATLRMDPSPLPPGPAMTTVPVFKRHSEMVAPGRIPADDVKSARVGMLVAGHKKDVVISNLLTNAPGRVAIYGWHRTNGIPIQPLYLGHSATWVDYSHGVRLVATNLTVNGRPGTLREVLQTPHLCSLLSHEGLMLSPGYGRSVEVIDGPPTTKMTPGDGERYHHVEVDPEMRVILSAPTRPHSNRPWHLVLYALPNGNTIEQTVGKRLSPGDDWHFDIQHIGAQARFVRALSTNVNWVVAYLEAHGKSWPAWRTRHQDAPVRIRAAVEKLVSDLHLGEAASVRFSLSGHSGGGSFIFGYLDSIEALPENLERIAFLDANYAYNPASGHPDKLAKWLADGTNHFLTVLAYHDSVALLDGRTFVSAAGGTWGRSHLMLTNLGRAFSFERRDQDDLRGHVALAGRMQFLLKPNPERKILHTLQVERNGFIHAMLCGTPWENSGYTYLGPRAFEYWIVP